MKIIDADKLHYKQVYIQTEKGLRPALVVFAKEIRKMPEIVRCKDCKKYIPCQKLPIGTSQWCDLFDRATCEMNYCGWGERREDG